jgi:hypothetical protein
MPLLPYGIYAPEGKQGRVSVFIARGAAVFVVEPVGVKCRPLSPAKWAYPPACATTPVVTDVTMAPHRHCRTLSVRFVHIAPTREKRRPAPYPAAPTGHNPPEMIICSLCPNGSFRAYRTVHPRPGSGIFQLLIPCAGIFISCAVIPHTLPCADIFPELHPLHPAFIPRAGDALPAGVPRHPSEVCRKWLAGCPVVGRGEGAGSRMPRSLPRGCSSDTGQNASGGKVPDAMEGRLPPETMEHRGIRLLR